MKIRVERNWLLGDTTLGKLFVDDRFFGYTLEDEVRNDKVYGQTAIPYGVYDVDITYSPKFGRNMPLIKNVPNFSGIRIHTGNSSDDTSGCLLVGLGIDANNNLTDSRLAFNSLNSKIKKTKDSGESITIEIKAPDVKPLIYTGVISLSLLGVGAFFLLKNKDLIKRLWTNL